MLKMNFRLCCKKKLFVSYTIASFQNCIYTCFGVLDYIIVGVNKYSEMIAFSFRALSKYGNIPIYK